MANFLSFSNQAIKPILTILPIVPGQFYTMIAFKLNMFWTKIWDKKNILITMYVLILNLNTTPEYIQYTDNRGYSNPSECWSDLQLGLCEPISQMVF